MFESLSSRSRTKRFVGLIPARGTPETTGLSERRRHVSPARACLAATYRKHASPGSLQQQNREVTASTTQRQIDTAAVCDIAVAAAWEREKNGSPTHKPG